MYFPRRYRRKLLFPPGLLALAFLLLLGCMQIAQDSRLKPRTIMQLNIPVLFSGRPLPEFLRNWFPYLPKKQIEKFREWDNLKITGNILHDSLSLLTTDKLVKAYLLDTLHARGLRIQFSNQAQYKSLVRALDVMAINNMKKYWLDIQHTPTTLYVFTDKIGTRRYAKFTCLLCNDVLPYRSETPQPLSFWRWLDKWATSFHEPETWQPLADPAWRNSLYLLLLLALISVWKIAKPAT